MLSNVYSLNGINFGLPNRAGAVTGCPATGTRAELLAGNPGYGLQKAGARKRKVKSKKKSVYKKRSKKSSRGGFLTKAIGKALLGNDYVTQYTNYETFLAELEKCRAKGIERQQCLESNGSNCDEVSCHVKYPSPNQPTISNRELQSENVRIIKEQADRETQSRTQLKNEQDQATQKSNAASNVAARKQQLESLTQEYNKVQYYLNEISEKIKKTPPGLELNRLTSEQYGLQNAMQNIESKYNILEKFAPDTKFATYT